MNKIIHMTSVHPPFDTRIFYKECRSLAKDNFDTILIAPNSGDLQVQGVRILAVKKQSSRLLRFIRTGFEVFRKALKERADIYHIHDPELLPWAQALRLAKRKVVYDMHENVSASIETKYWISPPIRRIVARLYRQVERKLLSGVYVIFAEESYKKHYSYLSSKSSLVLLNYPIIEEIDGAKAEKYQTPTVGYIGATGPERGDLVTAQALAILNRSMPVNWECIGSINKAQQANLLDILGATHRDRIQFRGRMALTEGLRIIAKCHIGLAVLQNVPNYLRSYPTKIFEYMALGLPVVVSNFPLYKKVVEQAGCGICVNPADPEEIADAIKRLIQNPTEAHEMGERGKFAVQKLYSWKSESEKLFRFYRELLTEE